MDSPAQPVRVGVLSLHNSKETKAILNAIDTLGHEPEWLRTETLMMRLGAAAALLEPEVDIVVNRLLLSRAKHPLEALSFAQALCWLSPMLNEPAAVLTAINKFATATRLLTNGLAIPEALLALDAGFLNEERTAFNAPAVYKTAIGTHGSGMWLIDPDEEVSPTVGHQWAFLQEFIEGEDDRHRDLRVYVVGDTVVAAMYRYAPAGDWRTNLARGGEAVDATPELPEEAATLALETAALLRLDYVGVDLVEGVDGWHVLEANPTAGFKGLFEATGVSPAPYIAQLAIERAGGTVDPERVAEVATELDDSLPACVPSERALHSEPPVIGYTEEVTVTGTVDSERVIAKADTGAKRTSIDTNLAASIGAGPIKNRIRVKTGSQKNRTSRPLVDLVIDLDDDRYTVTASVEDRSHMGHALLLGRDVLKHYHVDVRRRTSEASTSQDTS